MERNNNGDAVDNDINNIDDDNDIDDSSDCLLNIYCMAGILLKKWLQFILFNPPKKPHY